MTITKLRQCVFETNSSSSHSLSINKSNVLYDSIKPDKDGNIILYGGQFGWGWTKHDDCLTKANYCAVHAFKNEELTRRLKNVIVQHTGAKDVLIQLSLDYENVNFSYIDHQSLGYCNEAFKSDDTLKNFIFNRKSVLYIGNDNETAPPNFFDSDEDKMAKEYVLTLETCDERFYLSEEEKNNKDYIIECLVSLFHRSENYDGSKLSSMYHYDLFGEDRGIDFEKRLWNVYELKYEYDNKGEYIGEKRFNHTDLKWKLEKR